MPIWARRTTDRRVMSRSLNQIAPAVGSTWPEIMLMKVVLPAPFGPITQRTSPLASVKVEVLVRHQAAEALGQAVGPKQLGHGYSAAEAGSRSRPQARLRNSTMTAMKMRPTTSGQYSWIASMLER